jgi:hypothetical protein
VFGPLRLVLGISERTGVDVGNVGIEPLVVTPETTKNSHPADTLLALGDLVESTRTGYYLAIEQSVDGFIKKGGHRWRSE